LQVTLVLSRPWTLDYARLRRETVVVHPVELPLIVVVLPEGRG
jgi:hypothetical protein